MFTKQTRLGFDNIWSDLFVDTMLLIVTRGMESERLKDMIKIPSSINTSDFYIYYIWPQWCSPNILILWNIVARFCLLWLKCVFRGIFNEFKQFFLKFKSITILKLTSSDWFYLTFSPCLIRFWLKIDSDLKIRFIHWVWVLNVESLCCVGKVL